MSASELKPCGKCRQRNYCDGKKWCRGFIDYRSKRQKIAAWNRRAEEGDEK